MGQAGTGAARNGTGPLFRTLVGLGVVCSALIAMVYDLTQPLIRQQRLEVLEEAIFSLWPQGRAMQSLRVDAAGALSRVDAAAPTDDVAHAVYDANQRLLGFAIIASGMGYQDRIALLYAYDAREEQVKGIRVLESRETPGLGDRIGYDKRFTASFATLPIPLDDDGRLMNKLAAAKPGTRSQPWEIDTISGATISSRAVVDIVNRSAARWLSVLREESEKESR